MKRRPAGDGPPVFRVRLSATACALAAAILMLAAAPGQAQTQAQTQAQPEVQDKTEVKRFKDWTLRCRPKTETQARECVLAQSLVTNEDGRRILQVLIGHFGAERVLGALISVPIGVRLPPGVQLQIDDKEPLKYPLEFCNPRACQAQARLDDALLNMLKTGLMGHVSFQDSERRIVTIDFSLKGFTAAFKELP